MKNEQVAQLKTQGFFKKGDLLVYLVVLLLCVLLFVLFVFTKPVETLSGIKITYSDKRDETVIFTYAFEDDSYKIASAFADDITVEKSEKALFVTISLNGGHNTVVIEKSGKAYVSDADCSLRCDCAHFAPITDADGVILCVPHGIKIEGRGEKTDDGEVAIG